MMSDKPGSQFSAQEVRQAAGAELVVSLEAEVKLLVDPPATVPLTYLSAQVRYGWLALACPGCRRVDQFWCRESSMWLMPIVKTKFGPDGEYVVADPCPDCGTAERWMRFDIPGGRPESEVV